MQMNVGLRSREKNSATSRTIPSSSQRGSTIRIAPSKTLRRPVLAVGSVTLLVTCAALFALIYAHSSRLESVIAVARQVPQGQVVSLGDLRQVDISIGNGITAVPVDQAQEVVGKPAAVTLLVGTLLSPSDIGGPKALGSGEAVVGIDLKPGMVPASGVRPGERVLIVLTGQSGSPLTADASGGTASPGPRSSSAATFSTEVIAKATVVEVDDSPDDSGAGDVVASVEVASDMAPIVADASAAGQAALVQVGGEP